MLKKNYHLKVASGRGNDGHDHLVANILLGIVLSQLERLRDVFPQMRMVQQEVHGILHALRPDGHGDVVEPAQERPPERRVSAR